MSYVTLKEVLIDAKKNRYAVGAFNIVDYITTAAVIKAGDNKRSPVIIQTSTKTIDCYGYSAIAGWVKNLAQQVSIPVVLHLDHCKDIKMIQKCIEAGWSSVMIDASSFPFEKNIEMTKEVVRFARMKGVTVEGELGAIVGVEDDIFVTEQDSHLADPEACVEYVNSTGIDVLAPAIGTAHGIYHKEPNINFGLIEEIAKRTDMSIAIHGGTGLSTEIFKRCIQCGGTKINISTNIKHIFRDSFEKYYKENPKEYEPVKVIRYLEQNTIQGIENFIDIFGSSNRA